MRMALGKNIKRERELKGWTLEELSDRSGVAVGTIGALEVRDSKRSQYAAQICKALGFTVEQLSQEGPLGKTVKNAWPFETIRQEAVAALPSDLLKRLDTLMYLFALEAGYNLRETPKTRQVA